MRADIVFVGLYPKGSESHFVYIHQREKSVGYWILLVILFHFQKRYTLTPSPFFILAVNSAHLLCYICCLHTFRTFSPFHSTSQHILSFCRNFIIILANQALSNEWTSFDKNNNTRQASATNANRLSALLCRILCRDLVVVTIFGRVSFLSACSVKLAGWSKCLGHGESNCERGICWGSPATDPPQETFCKSVTSTQCVDDYFLLEKWLVFT